MSCLIEAKNPSVHNYLSIAKKNKQRKKNPEGFMPFRDYISSSSSSCRAASTYIPDPLRHFFLSFIAFGWSSGLHPVSSHSCCMYVRACRPAFAWPYAGVHRSTSLMSSSLLLQQCPACLVRLTYIVFVMGGKWPYSWCFVGC